MYSDRTWMADLYRATNVEVYFRCAELVGKPNRWERNRRIDDKLFVESALSGKFLPQFVQKLKPDRWRIQGGRFWNMAHVMMRIVACRHKCRLSFRARRKVRLLMGPAADKAADAGTAELKKSMDIGGAEGTTGINVFERVMELLIFWKPVVIDELKALGETTCGRYVWDFTFNRIW